MASNTSLSDYWKCDEYYQQEYLITNIIGTERMYCSLKKLTTKFESHNLDKSNTMLIIKMRWTDSRELIFKLVIFNLNFSVALFTVCLKLTKTGSTHQFNYVLALSKNNYEEGDLNGKTQIYIIKFKH